MLSLLSLKHRFTIGFKMRTQFSFYKSFDDVYSELSKEQKLMFIDTLLDVQFLRIKIKDVVFTDVILKHIWNAQKHSLEKSVGGYIESQKNSKIKQPYLGCYDDSFLPLQLPSEGDHKEEQEKGEEKGEEKEQVPYGEIISFLNTKANTDYREGTKKTKDLIRARFNENFTLNDFKKVIDIKCREWLYDDKMKKFLRPETLFGTKFESYLNQESIKINDKNGGWK